MSFEVRAALWACFTLVACSLDIPPTSQAIPDRGNAGEPSNEAGNSGTAGAPAGGADSAEAGDGGSGGQTGAGGATDDLTPVGDGGAGGDGSVEDIGPAGGEVRSNDGEVTLTIPAGALLDDTVITIERLAPVEPAIGPVYELKPDGLTFQKPVALTVEIPASAADDDFRGLRLATLRDGEWQQLAQQWLEYEPPSIGGLIEHFSRYAVIPGKPQACLCDVDATISCCDDESGTYGPPCSCMTIAGAIWDRSSCITTWAKEREQIWSLKECYDREAAELPPRYCSPDWEECCKQAGGIGPIGGGTTFYAASADDSKACVCDLGCGAAIAEHDHSLNWGRFNFLSCLAAKEDEGAPLIVPNAVCGTPGNVPGGTEHPGDGYCYGANSPALAGPSGFTWFMNSAKSSCSDLLCLPSPQRICASLEGTLHNKSVLGTYFNGPVNLSGYLGVSVTAEVLPVGVHFDLSVSSGNGIRGQTWNLISTPGLATYRVAFADGQVWSDDTSVFDLSFVEALDLSSPWETGGTVVVNLSAVQLGP